MLKRIRVSGYKSLAEVDLEVPKLAVLFGPNAGGKSNFLEALRLLSEISKGASPKGALDSLHRGRPIDSFFFGEAGIDNLRKKSRLTFSVEADLEVSKAVIEAVDRQVREVTGADDGNGREDPGKPLPAVRSRHLRYRIEIEMVPRHGSVHVSDERLVALDGSGGAEADRIPFIESEDGKVRLHGEHQDSVVDRERLTDRSVLSSGFYAPHHPHVAAVQKELGSWIFFHFEPIERMRTLMPGTDATRIGPMGEDLPSYFLTLRKRQPRRFDSVNRALSLLLPDLRSIDVEVNRFGEAELSLVQNGVTVPARTLSDGTLRILGMLAVGGAGMPPALIGLEEPEGGIHPESIALVGYLLENHMHSESTQCVVTTHSPLLLDRFPEDCLLLTRRRGGRTEIRPIATRKPGMHAHVTPALPGAPNAGLERDRDPVSHRLLSGEFGDE